MRITIKAARVNKGLRQTDVALALGVDRKTVGSWENGKTMPDVSLFEVLCEELNITVNELFLWVTTENLFSMFSAYQESMYEFKALIPRASLMPNEDLFTSIESGFKNPVEFLAVFRLPKVPQHTTRTSTRSLIVEEVNPMAAKPVRWEDRLIHELADKGLSGMYLLPEGQVGYCDSIVQSNKRLQKKELF
jgi:transcriptional regulator with XRE-family HTH domain